MGIDVFRKCSFLTRAWVTTLILAIFSIGGCAGDDGNTALTNLHRQHHAEADSDGDGVVSPGEQLASIKSHFDNMDVNSDGVITIADFYNEQQGATEGEEQINDISEHMPNVDANSDGTITLDEYKAHVQAKIDQADTDNNGSITLEEYLAYQETLATE